MVRSLHLKVSIFCLGMCRLLEYAPVYFDLKTFPDGETKRALQRVQMKRNGSRKGTPNNDIRDSKRRRQE